ncbi:MAG: hypothetical protein R3304_12775 [Longimicrobiales bacterium]|nr:hypothetical protein [Longimicrobiales bacterium]
MKRILRSRVTLALALAADLLLYAGSPGPYDYTESSFEAALEAQERVTDTWLAHEGVVGTAIGVDGRGQAVLKVYLSHPGSALLPNFVPITNGHVRVVHEVTGPFTALPAEATDDDGDAVDPTRGFPRPVPIGVSTGHGRVTAGTIGARATDGAQTFALSNNHIFAANNAGRTGDNLLQPGVVDGGRDPDDVIGTLYDFEPIEFCRALLCPSNTIDAAIALTSEDDVGAATPEGGYGSPRPWTAEAELGMSVQKYGRTTGHTAGQVSGLNATIDVGYRDGKARFEGQIVISGRGFSAGGDSGSLVVTKGLLVGDRRPVGLLFAGTATTTLANPIDVVLDRFGITIDGGP